jgi:tetratricopeptide (TPR) repeat protein
MRGAALACVGALLVACASSSPPPVSPLRTEALAAAEAGSRRLTGRHFAAAADSFGQAAQIYGVIDDPTAEAAALRNQAEALRRLGDLGAATAGFERALAIDRLGKRTDGQARDFAGLARCSSARGEVDCAIRQSEQALGLVSGAEALRASLEIDLAVYLLARGNSTDQGRIIGLLTSAGDRAAAEGEARTEATAHLHMGRAQRFFGSPELAEEPLRLALSEFQRLDDPEGLARTHEALGRLLNARNQPEAAKRHLEQARRGYEFLNDQAALAHLDELLVEMRD